eukprot:1214711-Pleurochrysis_carterae.AAC.1
MPVAAKDRNGGVVRIVCLSFPPTVPSSPLAAPPQFAFNHSANHTHTRCPSLSVVTSSRCTSVCRQLRACVCSCPLPFVRSLGPESNLLRVPLYQPLPSSPCRVPQQSHLHTSLLEVCQQCIGLAFSLARGCAELQLLHLATRSTSCIPQYDQFHVAEVGGKPGEGKPQREVARAKSRGERERERERA